MPGRVAGAILATGTSLQFAFACFPKGKLCWDVRAPVRAPGNTMPPSLCDCRRHRNAVKPRQSLHSCHRLTAICSCFVVGTLGKWFSLKHKKCSHISVAHFQKHIFLTYMFPYRITFTPQQLFREERVALMSETGAVCVCQTSRGSQPKVSGVEVLSVDGTLSLSLSLPLSFFFGPICKGGGFCH